MRLLLEAPWLPAPAVPSFLAATLPLGPDWATAALSTANNLVLLRPPDRWGAGGVGSGFRAALALESTQAAQRRRGSDWYASSTELAAC